MSELALVSRALRAPRPRAAVTVAGIAATALLVLTLLGAHRGLASGVHGLLDDPDADIWIAPSGVDNLIRSSAFLPEGTEVAAAGIEGVLSIAPVVRGFLRATMRRAEAEAPDSVSLVLLAIAHRVNAPGRPQRLLRGRQVSAAGEMVLDRAAAFRLGVAEGDSVTVNGQPVLISGISMSTNLLATQLAFIELESAARTLGSAGMTSFLIVTLADETQAHAVAATLQQSLPAVSTYTRDEFVAANVREVSNGVTPLMLLIATLGIAVAAALVVVLIQTQLAEQRFELACLLAVGASARMLAIALGIRAASVAAVGVVSGSVCALLLAAILDSLLPTVSLQTSISDHLGVFLLLEAGALSAATLPLLNLRRVDPLEAFRA